MRLIDDELVAADGSERRPVVCAQCGSTVLRNLRMGVTRAREDLASLTGEPVGELTADSGPGRCREDRIAIGTEAVLWRHPGRPPRSCSWTSTRNCWRPGSGPRNRRWRCWPGPPGWWADAEDEGRLVIQTRQPDHPVVRAAVRADPSIVAAVEREHRRELGLPPFGAQARVSGPGAEAYISALREGAAAAVSIRGPLDGQYLLRATTHQPLLDLLAGTPRPAQRLRVEVDPLRV